MNTTAAPSRRVASQPGPGPAFLLLSKGCRISCGLVSAMSLAFAVYIVWIQAHKEPAYVAYVGVVFLGYLALATLGFLVSTALAVATSSLGERDLLATPHAIRSFGMWKVTCLVVFLAISLAELIA